MTNDRPRPFGVSFISVLIVVLGALEAVGGVLLLFQSGQDELLGAAGVSSGQITTYAMFSIMFGIIVVLIGMALRGGAIWARYVVGILSAVRLASLIWVVVSYHNMHWYTAIWPMVIYALIAGYLFTDEDAKAYFGP